MNQKIRIKLKSFDHNLVDKSAEKIVKTVKSTGAVVSGPVPLPTHKQIFTVNRSTFVNKKAREQFQLCTFKRNLFRIVPPPGVEPVRQPFPARFAATGSQMFPTVLRRSLYTLY